MPARIYVLFPCRTGKISVPVAYEHGQCEPPYLCHTEMNQARAPLCWYCAAPRLPDCAFTADKSALRLELDESTASYYEYHNPHIM